MKMKLTLLDGRVVEADGTPEELAQLTERLSPVKQSYDYTEMHRLLDELRKLNEKQAAPYPWGVLPYLAPLPLRPYPERYDPYITWGCHGLSATGKHVVGTDGNNYDPLR